MGNEDKHKRDGTIEQFLKGTHSFDGVWFGEKHPVHKGEFWWREFLRYDSEVDRLKNELSTLRLIRLIERKINPHDY